MTETRPRPASAKPALSKLKSTAKIPGSLQSARKLAAQQPAQVQQAGAAEEESHTKTTRLPDREYTEEEFMAAWQQYALKLKEEKRQGEYIVLKEAPELAENHLARVRITNTVQQDFFEKAKPGAVAYLRKALQNSQITLDFVVVKEEEGRRLYTAQEKFGYLLQKYPQLQALKERLGLEADF